MLPDFSLFYYRVFFSTQLSTGLLPNIPKRAFFALTMGVLNSLLEGNLSFCCMLHTRDSFSSKDALGFSQKAFQEGDRGTAYMYALFAIHLLSQHTNTPEQQEEAERISSSLPMLAQYKKLLETAKARALLAQTKAYAPYSGFFVGAAMLATDGTVWNGCNVESSSYGLTICAERTALATAIAHGKRHFTAVVVATSATPPSPPCGACRQLLCEFAPTAIVLRINTVGEELWTTIPALLPEAFLLRGLE